MRRKLPPFTLDLRPRRGQALALLAVVLFALTAIIALVVDGGMMFSTYRDMQSVVDAAATAAARDLARGESVTFAKATATDYVRVQNGQSAADVEVHIPPSSGPFAGNASFVEVIATEQVPVYFSRVTGGEPHYPVKTRGVAGVENATAGGAVLALDPTPSPITVSASALGLVSVSVTVPPANIGGLETLGVGQVKVDGSVQVNTEWGGFDERGCPVGDCAGPPYGASCTPLIPLTRLMAQDVRVVGGVDNPDCYGPYHTSKHCVLQANRLPVPDPFETLPAPTTSSDPTNVVTTNRGGVAVTGLPLIGPTKHLYPGVYDWISVVSGIAVFHPGVYIIRGKNPLTQIPLSIVAGKVTANGVMFYITNSSTYNAVTGAPDASDGETEPPVPGVTSLVPSAVISAALLGSDFTGLSDSGSPFDRMLIYQRRQDRRPVVIVGEQIVGCGSFTGSVYAKWGQVLFAASGSYDLQIVGGTVRFVNVLSTTIAPTSLLPAAKDVYLVE